MNITLTLEVLHGHHKKAEEIRVTFKKIVQQESGTSEAIEKGTFFICKPYHKVIDCILYSEEGDFFFIQISVRNYQDHATKSEDIFKEVPKSTSVYYQYLSKAGFKGVQDAVKSKHFLANTHYLYITCNTPETQSISSNVKLIALEQLKRFADAHLLSYFTDKHLDL